MSDVYVFCGPTIDPATGRELIDAVFLPPVSQGDVYRVAVRRPTAIGIIDGRFHDVPAVWHKEILWALAQGIPVYGSASMGALRAAELAPFGMVGVGRIFEAYRDGVLEDDDEVTVAHLGAENGYRPTSEAMVNIRTTLACAEAAGLITAATRQRLIDLAKVAFYPLRGYRMMFEAARAAGLAADELDALATWLPEHRVDRKRADAIEMLQAMRTPAAPAIAFTFEHTQFFEHARRSAGDLVITPAGDSADGERADVTLDDLLDELRLDPMAFAAVRDRALARYLAVQRAVTAPAADNASLQSVANDFRRERNLLEPDETRQWLADQHLTVHQFAALVREEHALRQAVHASESELDIHLRTQLRVDGRYPALAQRVRDKHHVLGGFGYDDATGPGDDESDAAVRAWYFEHRGQAIPDDVGEYARSLGFADEIAFTRAIRREHAYLTLAGIDAPVAISHDSDDVDGAPARGEVT